jgi:hypothetical protein
MTEAITRIEAPWSFGPSNRLMAGGADIADGILERCAEAAKAIHEGLYELKRLPTSMTGTDLWLIPGARAPSGLGEIRIMPDPVPINALDDRIVAALVASALSGVLMSDQESERAIDALQAVAAAEDLIARCVQGRRRTMRIALPTPWGVACCRDMTTTFSAQATRIRPMAHLPVRPIGGHAGLLPSATMVGYRNEPDHFGHIRIEPVSVFHTEDAVMDPMETMRVLADLGERPFR